MAVVYSTPHSGTPLRSLEKVLEDAQMTGMLNIGGRNMREYPQIAVNYDLEDTTGADLSKNKLGELPQDVCSYLSLQTLNCYNNFIRAIPFEIINLTALTYLNLSRNQLSTLPVHVCDLFLEVLIVSNNKLVSLPPEIGKMKTLMHLDASCNELSTLPVEIGGAESLKELNVRRNQLVTVPEEISNLSLVKLDFSCNKITLLPPSYRNISTLEELNVSENPLENPPAQLCIRGKIHIFKFLSKKAQKDDKHRGLFDQQDTTSWQRRNHNHPRMANELAFFDDKMGELRRGLTGADSGYIEGDKRWSSSEASNEDEEARQLAERAAQQKEWRQNRGSWQQKIIDSRSYQPQENITFIDAGVEERTSENEPTPVQSPTVTPKPTPIQTPTMSNDVDPFTKELARQKANYEDQKRRAREERLRKEMEEAKAQQRLEMPPHMVNHIPPNVNGIHSPTKGSPPSHMNGPTTVISPNGQLANGPTSIKVNGQVNGPTVDPVRTPLAGTQTRPVISTTVVKEALVVENTVNETSSKPLSERRRDDTTRTAISKPQNGTTNGALNNNLVQRRTMSTSAVSEPAKKANASTNWYTYSPPKSQQRRATTGITSLREPVQNGPTTKVVSNGPTRKVSDGVTIGGSAISQERHEAQLARRKKEEEKQKVKQQQKDAVMNFVKRASSKTAPPASSTTSSAQKTTSSTERRNSGGRPSSRLSNSSSVSSSSQRSGSTAPSSSSYPDSAFGSIKPRSAFSISSNKSSNEKQQTNFTVKREMRQLKEEMDRIEQLKKYIEARLKMTLSEDLPGELMDGVKLCHLINHVRPHAVSQIYLPAGANKLTAAKCRRNVDNFVKACQQAGVPKDKLCTSADILEGKGLAKVALTVIALMQIHGSSRSSYVAS